MEPVRTCVGCRQRTKSTELVRVVARGEILELREQSQGRGAWLHRSKNCLKLAVERQAFVRAFRVKKQFDTAELTAQIEQAETMLAQK